MSIQDGKIKISTNARRNSFIAAALVCLQLVLSVFLSISLAAHLIWPENARGALGTPMMIAYEGRLTDSSGNALGGTGSPYCFRFSIYDAVSSGNKLWPSGATPASTVATSTDGVFNAVIGSADTLSSTVFDFSTTSSAYLQVDAYNVSSATCTGGAWESLSPRQQLLASGYALSANNMPLLRNNLSSSIVQVGSTAGAGTASPVYLGLDVKNTADYVGQTCTTSGQMWYNSATSHALICEAGVIQELGVAATTTIGAITANGGTTATAGTVNFSNSNGVTFGINGNTITASVAGGAAPVLSRYDVPVYGSMSSSQQTQSSASFRQFQLPSGVSFSRIDIPILVSIASTTTANTADMLISSGLVIYSRNGSTLSPLMGSFGTTTYTWASSSNWASLTGGKYASFALNSSLSAGEYWLGFQMSTNNNSSIGTATTALGNTISIPFGTTYTASLFGNFGNTYSGSTNVSLNGVYSTTITATNQTIAMSNITVTAATANRANFSVIFRNW